MRQVMVNTTDKCRRYYNVAHKEDVAYIRSYVDSNNYNNIYPVLVGRALDTRSIQKFDNSNKEDHKVCDILLGMTEQERALVLSNPEFVCRGECHKCDIEWGIPIEK